jgi:ferredoxin
MGTHLAVDWTRCDGRGLCAELLPERMQLDEWGFPILSDTAVDPADPADTKAVRRAVAVCPTLALRLTNDVNGAGG